MYQLIVAIIPIPKSAQRAIAAIYDGSRAFTVNYDKAAGWTGRVV